MTIRSLLGCLAFAGWVCGCGSEATTPVIAAGSQGSTSGGMGGMSGGGGSGAAGGSTGEGGAGGAPAFFGDCRTSPPPGVELAPAPPPYSGGACPALVAGKNVIQSSGNAREFLLILPTDFDPKEVLPVIFLWHWMGASADDFLERGEVQAAVDAQRFIAVIPESKGDTQFKWPFEIIAKDARVEEEFVFFDDMLSCVSAQYSVNKECVASAGVSAGALFTDQLAGGRGQYLSSIISLSGGVGGSVIRKWKAPDHKMPAIVLWGGPSDQCFFVMNFEQTSKELEGELTTGGHFFLECVHNCGHAEPPFEAPSGLSKYSAIWQFAFDHPYWLKAGTSPYVKDGLPKDLPSWCAIGAGSAAPRTGDCPNKPGC